MIDNLLNGFSLRRIAEENNISVLTSFRLRHKVLYALKTFIKSIRLSGKIQSDEKYFSINYYEYYFYQLDKCFLLPRYLVLEFEYDLLEYDEFFLRFHHY